MLLRLGWILETRKRSIPQVLAKATRHQTTSTPLSVPTIDKRPPAPIFPRARAETRRTFSIREKSFQDRSKYPTCRRPPGPLPIGYRIKACHNFSCKTPTRDPSDRKSVV